MTDRQDSWTVLEALQWTTGWFQRKGALSARLDAELLLCEVLGLERIQLYVNYARPLDGRERDRYRELVARRGRGEPVQYILGEQEFWSLPLEVTPGVLIPRADTEVLVEEAVAEGKRILEARGLPEDGPLLVAEVGTGTGAIAAALATELKGARIAAGDVMDAPLALAPRNLEALGLSDRVEVVRGGGVIPLWEHLGREPLDVIVSNPPYIRAGDHPGLMREVRDFEPVEALVAGEDGLDVVREIVAAAARPGVLRAGGALALEIGDRLQAVTTRDLMRQAGFVDIRVRDDYASNPRAVVGARAEG